MKKVILVLFLFILKSSMSQIAGEANSDWRKQFPNTVVYQIFTRSFADGNGDGIGDLEGVRRKLPYLQELGIGAIWLTPIFESPSYHKYDITDYYKIDKECGTAADLKNLIEDAHRLNIKIILDFVANHTSTEHPWFKEAVKGNPEYKNYYLWSSNKAEWNKEPDHWHWVDDTKKGTEKYYGMFWRGMPDLNYENQKMRNEVIAAAEYWIKEFHIDGYRLDAASHIYPYLLRTSNYAWWKQFSDSMRSVKPDFYLVGEMWGGDTLIAPYLKAGMNAGFNFDLWFNIKASLQKEDDLITKKLFAAYENYSMNNPIFCDATLLSNHDNPRIMNEVKGNMDKAKLAAAILLTLPYTPYIYYGDELGMFGPKPDEHIREPFLWAQKDKAKCSWELNYNNKNTSTFPEQSSDPASIYNTYKSLIQFRNSNEVLTDGKLIPAPIIKTGILAYIRQNNGKQYLVLHNLSSSTLDVDLSALNKNDYRIVFNTGVLPIIKTNFITLQKYSSVIIDF